MLKVAIVAAAVGGMLTVVEGPLLIVDDSQVAFLIRQHARRAVSEFVADGMDRAMRPTRLPPG